MSNLFRSSLVAVLAVLSFTAVDAAGSSRVDAACRVSTVESQGRANTGVACIQEALTDAGFAPGPVDGVFGAQTASAVRSFQRRAGLGVTGVVAPTTARALGIWRNPPCAPKQTVPAGARTVLDVRSSGSWATVRLMKRTDSGWRCRGRVMTGRVGRNGVTPLAERVGGDGTTPRGVFRLGRMTAPDGDVFKFFGTRADPGVKGAWHDVQPGDCWWVEPGSKKYNRLISRTPPRCSGGNEYLPSYRNSYSRAALIAANMGPRRVGDEPGEMARAAAIFLHRHARDTSGESKATSGCVSLTGAHLDFVLRRMPLTGTWFVIS